ncbi:hypothetical protein Hanom_Chr02g00168781 [Helianthus anomalus]
MVHMYQLCLLIQLAYNQLNKPSSSLHFELIKKTIFKRAEPEPTLVWLGSFTTLVWHKPKYHNIKIIKLSYFIDY